MKVFEFHLNPKLRPHTDFQAFCYEPEKADEKHLGNLCLAGELENILPPNKKLLKELSEVIKNAYYLPEHENAETALQNALRQANNFLSSQVKQGNVSWMGNLHFVVMSIAADFLCFSKTGGIKIIMARHGEMLDIGAELETQDRTSTPREVWGGAYSPQVFPSLILGRIEIGDKILAVTPDAMQLFEVLNLLPAISAMLPGKEDKQLRQILKPHQKTLKDYSGLLLIWYIDKISKIPKQKDLLLATPIRKLTVGALYKTLIKALTFPARILAAFPPKPQGAGPGLVQSKLQLPFKLRLQRPSFAFLKNPASFEWAKNAGQNPVFQKGVFLILALAVVLAVGFSLAQIQRKRAIDLAEEQLSLVRNTIWEAQQRLILNQEKEANKLFKEALLKLQSLKNSPRQKQAEKLTNEVMEKLTAINKIETVAEPELLFSLQELDFNPQNMELADNILYFLHPEFGKIYSWDLVQNKSETFELEKPFQLATIIGNILVFYEKENRRIFTVDGQKSDLFPSYPEFTPSLLASFGNNLYFLDGSKGQIIKYPLLLTQPQLAPISWLATPNKQLQNARSMAIDGSIWVLSADAKIHRYFAGAWQETLDLSIWPELIRPAKIYTAQGLPYLYTLDPLEKRFIILNKQGGVIKQYRSEKFDSLKDFAISKDGKMVYLLNGQSVYTLSVGL